MIDMFQHFLAGIGSYGLQILFVIIGAAACYVYYKDNSRGEQIGR